MISEPLISVIVPVYNVEGYLDQCLESIVGQSYRHLEIHLAVIINTVCSPCAELIAKRQILNVVQF